MEKEEAQANHQTFNQLAHELIRLTLRNAPRTELEKIAKLAQAQARQEKAPELIWYTSSVSAQTFDPFITISWGDLEQQMTIKEARDQAIGLLEVIEAAIGDAFLTRFLIDEVKAEKGQIAALLVKFRGYRAALAERNA